VNNRIESWLYWKHNPRTYSRLEDVCSICDGFEEVEANSATIDCICASERWAASIKETLDPLRSAVEDADFNLEPVAINGDQLENAIVMANDWAKAPSGVLLLSGGYGIGKSHLLRAINTELYPIALYLTSSEFEWSCFRAMESSSLHVYVDIVAHCPVLLFDDYGMEYGAEFIWTQMTHVIDVRVRTISDYPMAVASNKSGREIQHEGRIGSRLMDTEYLQYAKMRGIPDYRTRGLGP